MDRSTEMTLDDLLTLLVQCAGEDESLTAGGEVLDTSFEDLGYDSLALMETAARIAREYGVRIPDEQIAELETPRAVLDVVNRRLAA